MTSSCSNDMLASLNSTYGRRNFELTGPHVFVESLPVRIRPLG
jgi:hypothetical protein